jgi:hypothetical protein
MLVKLEHTLEFHSTYLRSVLQTADLMYLPLVNPRIAPRNSESLRHLGDVYHSSFQGVHDFRIGCLHEKALIDRI